MTKLKKENQKMEKIIEILHSKEKPENLRRVTGMSLKAVLKAGGGLAQLQDTIIDLMADKFYERFVKQRPIDMSVMYFDSKDPDNQEVLR